MLIKLISTDYAAVVSFSVLIVCIPLLILIIKTKQLPAKAGKPLELSGIGLIITVAIHSIIIITALGILVFKILFYNYYLNNGIKREAIIHSLQISKNINKGYTLILYYSYNNLLGNYKGETKILNEKEFGNYKINDRIIILMNPKDNSKSIYYGR